MYYKNLLMTLLSIFMMGAYGCSGEEVIEPEPAPLPEQEKILLNTQSLTVEETESTATLTFITNRAWTATSDQAWCTLSQTSGSAGSISITVNVTANTTNQERTATITIKSSTQTATATVKQAPKKEEADKVELDNTSFSVESEAGSVTLKITTNKDWTATSDQSWCKLSANEGQAGTADLTISYEANPNEAERTATITVKAGTATATATVKQAKKKADEGGGEQGGGEDSGEEGANGGSIEDMNNKKW